MANYTSTKLKIRNPKNSSSFFNNLNKTSGTMTITPNNGYVVSASDFYINASDIPSSLSSVEFTDMFTPGEIKNKVIVKVTFSSTFVANRNIKISLIIQGAAKVW